MSEEKKIWTTQDFKHNKVWIEFSGNYELLRRIESNICDSIVDLYSFKKGDIISCYFNPQNNQTNLCNGGNQGAKLKVNLVSENEIYLVGNRSCGDFLKKLIHLNKDSIINTPNVLLEDMAQTFEKCLEVATRKNSDYGGKDSNPYQNFSNSEIVGVSIPKGIMVRMMDKVSRISTLLEKEAQVKDEAIEDTLDDLINYTAILKSYLKRNK